MADTQYDFAVLGSTPLAFLLAGLLASAHGKRIVLVGEAPSPWRPIRSFDLSIAPLTRPETWALLKRTTPETIKLLAGIGKGLHARLDPLLNPDTDTGRIALGHIRHIAAAFGYPVAQHGEAVQFRYATLLRPLRLAEAITPWLDRGGVLRPTGAAVSIRRDGSVRLDTGRVSIEARQAILADDAAILSHLGADGDRLRATHLTSLLTEPLAALPAPLTLRVESGVILSQRRNGMVDWLGPDKAPLGIDGPRAAGRASFRAVASADGAPVIGTIRGRYVLAGLGPVGAFLVPALARFIAGTAVDQELAWFVARDPGKGRGVVTEFGVAA